ncbi:MAG: galactokinase [Sphingopyxis sp.]|nr:galactokinase [Sphingopyxis sp.]
MAAFADAFGGTPTLLTRAPGRVNLIGEHTDYNDGFVMPLAIDCDTVAVARPNDSGMIRVVAADIAHAPGSANAQDSFALNAAITPGDADWANYVRGMARALADEGGRWSGVDLAIAGDVPLGSGLSSSASLEMAVGLSLATMAGVAVERPTLARMGQWAEHHFAGCLCGIMDQLISACGVADHAMLIDCRTLATAPVPLPPHARVIIAHSGVRHAHAGGEYNDRRAQCEAAAAHYGVTALRDLDEASLIARRGTLGDLPFRRARHVVTENARTLAAADALRAGDLAAMGQLMAASHASMRDDFAITVPAIDALADIMAAPLHGVGGARMTGGGFGGCVIALAPTDRVDAVIDAVATHYRDPEGNPATVFVAQASAGASVLS